MSKRVVITEATVLEAMRSGLNFVEASTNAIITPLARDTAREHGVPFVPPRAAGGVSAGSSARPDPSTEVRTTNPTTAPLIRPDAPRVAVASDHGGYNLKTLLLPYIATLGWRSIDLGTDSDERVDYPDYAYAVARSVVDGDATLGLMIDGAGPGSAIVCNKVPGIRAVAAAGEFVAWNARAHNDCNVLTLGSRVTGVEVCKRILKVFLETAFEGGRHAGRTGKISDLERRFAID